MTSLLLAPKIRRATCEAARLAEPAQGSPVVALEGVGKRFPGHTCVDALTDLNLRIASGEWVAIVGPSGSGKSTLLNIIGCLDTQTSGTYQFDGVDVASLSDSQRAGLRSRGIGFVFQAFHLLPYRTVIENVMLADLYRRDRYREQGSRSSRNRHEERKSSANAALVKVGLAHRARFLPTRLSGGERQRVAIARALLGTPRLLLCDEPTGNLDSDATQSVLDLFSTLHRQGMTIAMITHDRAVASCARRQIRLTDGRLTEER